MIFFEFLVFQLRCNESVQILRKSDYKKAFENFSALMDNLPSFPQDELIELRNSFRNERKQDLKIQLFDLGTFYHYLGVAYWLQSDIE